MTLFVYFRSGKFIEQLPCIFAMYFYMEGSRKIKLIDVDAIIREKNPSLYRLLPRFVLSYIKKKIHQDFLNRGIEKYKDVYHLEFNSSALEWMGAQVSWTGEENIPVSGGVIVCSNHPLGGLDGMALIKAVSSRRKDIRFLVNDILTNFENFQTLFVAVNKVGSNTKEALRVIDEVYAGNEAVLVFPAGLVSRKQQGKIKDLEWKKSFIAKAVETRKDVVPVFIDGKNSDFFYNFALWRKRLGIKANIEMFFLPDEMVNQKGKFIRITFGKPIPWQIFDRSFTPLGWAQLVREFVYQLKENPAADFSVFIREHSRLENRHE